MNEFFTINTTTHANRGEQCGSRYTILFDAMYVMYELIDGRNKRSIATVAMHSNSSSSIASDCISRSTPSQTKFEHTIFDRLKPNSHILSTGGLDLSSTTLTPSANTVTSITPYSTSAKSSTSPYRYIKLVSSDSASLLELHIIISTATDTAKHRSVIAAVTVEL